MKVITREQDFESDLSRWMRGNSDVRLKVEALKRKPTEEDMDKIIERRFLDFHCDECDKQVGSVIEFGDYYSENRFVVCRDCLKRAIEALL